MYFVNTTHTIACIYKTLHTTKLSFPLFCLTVRVRRVEVPLLLARIQGLALPRVPHPRRAQSGRAGDVQVLRPGYAEVQGRVLCAREEVSAELEGEDVEGRAAVRRMGRKTQGDRRMR